MRVAEGLDRPCIKFNRLLLGGKAIEKVCIVNKAWPQGGASWPSGDKLKEFKPRNWQHSPGDCRFKCWPLCLPKFGEPIPDQEHLPFSFAFDRKSYETDGPAAISLSPDSGVVGPGTRSSS